MSEHEPRRVTKPNLIIFAAETSSKFLVVNAGKPNEEPPSIRVIDYSQVYDARLFTTFAKALAMKKFTGMESVHKTGREILNMLTVNRIARLSQMEPRTTSTVQLVPVENVETLLQTDSYSTHKARIIELGLIDDFLEKASDLRAHATVFGREYHSIMWQNPSSVLQDN